MIKASETYEGEGNVKTGVNIDTVVSWRDVEPGEAAISGDRLYVSRTGWITADEMNCVGEIVTKHWVPIQRRVN